MPHHLSEQQLAIIRVLWDRGSATVAEVQQAVESQSPLAYSTVATVLARMERKGVVRHRVEGRTYIYEPVVGEERVSKSLVRDLVERVFHGSPSQLVSHLLESEDVDQEELGRIKALLADYEATRRRAESKSTKRGKHRG